MFEPARRVVFRDQAAGALTHAILTGRLQPGQAITERQLAHDLQISRAPIREALRELEKAGLIVTRPHKGTYVASFNDEDVEEIYSLRATLELMAIRRAVERATKADIESLENEIEEMQRYSDRDFNATIAIDLTFHRRIVEIAAHRRLLDAWDLLANQLRALYTITDVPNLIRSLYGYVEDMPDRHRPIVDHIRNRDVSRASDYIYEHITDVADTIVRQRAQAATATQPPDSTDQ